MFLKFNSRGLRGPERGYEKPAGTFRTLLLGDSFTDGYINLNRDFDPDGHALTDTQSYSDENADADPNALTTANGYGKRIR